jgi:hypothetical protein
VQQLSPVPARHRIRSNLIAFNSGKKHSVKVSEYLRNALPKKMRLELETIH